MRKSPYDCWLTRVGDPFDLLMPVRFLYAAACIAHYLLTCAARAARNYRAATNGAEEIQ